MTDHEIELDLQLGEAQDEINILRRQLKAAVDEALWLRQTLESVYAVSHTALHAGKSDGATESSASVGKTKTKPKIKTH